MCAAFSADPDDHHGCRSRRAAIGVEHGNRLRTEASAWHHDRRWFDHEPDTHTVYHPSGLPLSGRPPPLVGSPPRETASLSSFRTRIGGRISQEGRMRDSSFGLSLPRVMSMSTAFKPLTFLMLGLLTGCSFAPKYSQPSVQTPPAFKELTPEQFKDTAGWKAAEPKDDAIRGKWWEMFADTNLNALEEQADVSNQNLAAAFANFLAARAVVKQNRAELFPTLGANPSVTRTRQSAVRTQTGSFSGSRTFTEYSLPLDASWELNLWGRVRNTVKASSIEAQATLADLENVRLTIHAELAADYFQVRALDEQKQLLDEAVVAYRESLKLTQVRHDTGIASDQDVAQAETQLNVTEVQATD